MWEQLSDTVWARKGIGFVFIPEERSGYVGKPEGRPARRFPTLEAAIKYVDRNK